MSVYAWIISIIGPLVVRGIIAAGFTAVTYSGVTIILNQLVTMAQNNWAALPVAVLQLATLSGIPTVLGMIFGAYASRIAFFAAVSAKQYVLKR